MRKASTEIGIIIMLWISIAISIYLNPKFGSQFILGIISITIVSIAFIFKKRDLSLGILTFALIFSTFNIIKFSEAFGLSISFIQLIPFLSIVVLLFSRLTDLINLKDKWFGSEPAEVEKAKLNKVAIYKRELQSLSSDELIRRKNNYELVEEARIAIDQILTERNISTTGNPC